MGSWKIVLIDKTTGSVVPPGQLQQIAAAVQQQVDNDFAPVWGSRADISAPAAGEAIPPGAWPVNVVNSLNPHESGTHLDDQAQPYAQVVNGPDLSSVISHEVLEMLADPWGNRFAPGPDIDTSNAGREVFYLVEVCDPCESSKYPIDGVQVSDFVRPSFYDPNGVAPFDFLTTLAGPLKVPQGGYISWMDPVDWKWHRITTDGSIVTGDVTPGRNPREDRNKAMMSISRLLPPLDRGQCERERELPVEEDQAALLELFEHFLDCFHGKAQIQFPTDRGSGGWTVTA